MSSVTKAATFALLIILILSGCMSKPMLDVGSCYGIPIHDYDDINFGHILSSFKVTKIFKYKGQLHYQILILHPNKIAEPLYYKSPEARGYARVYEFDKYVSPIVSQTTPAAPELHPIKCNSIKEQDVLRPKLYNIGQKGN